MGSNSPERELEEFLASKPSWLRKILQLDYSFSDDEQKALTESNWWQDGGKDEEEYIRLLQRVPRKWREHRRRKREDALRDLPTAPPGRPRLDDRANEARQLKEAGKSYAQVAQILNSRHGEKTTTPEAVRKLLHSRKKKPTPDKTQR